MGVQMAVVAGGPRLGDLEAGAVATAFGDTASVVSGGLACVAGALVVAWALPGFTRMRSAPHKRAQLPEAQQPEAGQPEEVPTPAE
jgi:sugar (pentulose or hexulose) kinase